MFSEYVKFPTGSARIHHQGTPLNENMPRLTLCPECGKKARSAAPRCETCGTWLISIEHMEKKDPLVGKSIDDRFIITELIAKGGMGAVYKAYQASVDRHIVVKVLHQRFEQREDSIQRFFREAKASSKLNHHHIVQIYDFGQTDDGMLYMMMEYLDGTLLYDLMAWGPLAPARTINILSQVCDALTVAHENGVIHRDLKPENIFLLDRAGAPDFVKVFDFGIAKTEDSEGADPEKKLTSEKSIFGTPHYMSPEQALGEAPDPRSDIYALGIILYEMLAGAHPFESDDPITLLRQHLRDTLPPLTTACPDFVLPPEIDEVFASLVAKNPDDRPANARAAKSMLLKVFKDISGDGYNVQDHTPVATSSQRTTVELESSLPALAVQAMERENRFIEIMTHELRTALTVVSSSVELMADEKLGDVTDKQGQFLKMIKRNIDRMSRFSTNVLSLSRLDTDRYNLNLNEISLKAAIEQPLLRLKREALDKGISIVLDSRVDPEIKVVADPGAISLVISNLLSNVLMIHGQVTTARVGYTSASEHFTEVWITDDGPGIPAEDQKDLFDRFRQSGGDQMIGLRGTGIRLAVCKALVERMEGKISVESKGEGTTFRFTLPTPKASREFLFGRLATLAGYLTPEQLREAINEQLSGTVPRRRLGEILVENNVLTVVEVEEVLRMQGERLDKPHSHLPVRLGDGLFGKLALKYTYVTREQLDRCICLQEARRDQGKPLRLGQVLVERDQMTAGEVVSVLKMQKVHMATCSSCARRYNVASGKDAGGEPCPACGAALAPEDEPDRVDVEGDVLPGK